MRSDTECHPPSLLCSISIKIFHFHQLVLANILTIDTLLSSASSLRITVSLGCWCSTQRHYAEGIRGAEIQRVLSLQLWALAWWLRPPWGTIFPNSHSLHYRLRGPFLTRVTSEFGFSLCFIFYDGLIYALHKNKQTKKYVEVLTPSYSRRWPYLELGSLQMWIVEFKWSHTAIRCTYNPEWLVSS